MDPQAGDALTKVLYATWLGDRPSMTRQVAHVFIYGFRV